MVNKSDIIYPAHELGRFCLLDHTPPLHTIDIACKPKYHPSPPLVLNMRSSANLFIPLVALLCMLSVDCAHLRKSEVIGQDAETKLNDGHQQQSTQGGTRRALPEVGARSVGLVASMNLHLGLNNERQRPLATVCLRRTSANVLRLLNKGFEDVIGRSRFILGTMSLRNHACGSERRLVLDSKWHGSGGGEVEANQVEDEHFHSQHGLGDERELQFRNFDYSYLFRGGATCQLCYPDNSDAKTAYPPEFNENIHELAAELSAHLTSVMQLSGIRCIAQRSPRATVTLEGTSVHEAEEADC